jgi:hypothetical protein
MLREAELLAYASKACEKRFQGESNSHHLIDNQGSWPLDDGTVDSGTPPLSKKGGSGEGALLGGSLDPPPNRKKSTAGRI